MAQWDRILFHCLLESTYITRGSRGLILQLTRSVFFFTSAGREMDEPARWSVLKNNNRKKKKQPSKVSKGEFIDALPNP